MCALVLAHGAAHVLEVVGVFVGVAAPFVMLAVLVTVVRRRDAREAESGGQANRAGPVEGHSSTT